MFFKSADPSKSDRGFAVLRYIKSLTKPLTRLLRNNGIQTASRPLKTLQQEFVSPKSRPPVVQQTNVVYKIPCAGCPWSYIGETGRCLKTRVKEHTRNIGSNIAAHAWLNDHSIDFKSAHVIDNGNFRVRKTLESWHTAITSDADNNARKLPRQYSILWAMGNFIMIFLSAFYSHLSIFIVFIIISLSHTFFVVYILMFALFIHHLSKIADGQSKGCKLLNFLTRERSKSYSLRNNFDLCFSDALGISA